MLSAACDDYAKVYVDGALATPSNTAEKKWNASSNYNMHACNTLIAISCQDIGTPGGILASTTTGVMTDTTWRCTDRLEFGWETVGFTESDGVWGTPGTYGSNRPGETRHGNMRHIPIAHMPAISYSADWIWFGSNDLDGDLKTVYCRKEL